MKRSSTHVPKSKAEQEEFVWAIREVKESPTIPVLGVGKSTLESIGDDTDASSYKKPRKSPANRILLRLKENWVSFLVPVVIAIAGYFLVTAKVEVAKLNKDFEYQYKDIGHQAENLNKAVEKIEELSRDITTIHSEVKSLNDRFQMFIDIFASRNQ
jgi:hypothetical protein